MLAANLKIAADIKIALVTTSGKTRKTFFGLGGTAPKVFPVFRVMAAKLQVILKLIRFRKLFPPIRFCPKRVIIIGGV